MAWVGFNRLLRHVVAERRRRAVDLWFHGCSYREIGRQLGISHTAARRHVIRALAVAEPELEVVDGHLLATEAAWRRILPALRERLEVVAAWRELNRRKIGLHNMPSTAGDRAAKAADAHRRERRSVPS